MLSWGSTLTLQCTGRSLEVTPSAGWLIEVTSPVSDLNGTWQIIEKGGPPYLMIHDIPNLPEHIAGDGFVQPLLPPPSLLDPERGMKEAAELLRTLRTSVQGKRPEYSRIAMEAEFSYIEYQEANPLLCYYKPGHVLGITADTLEATLRDLQKYGTLTQWLLKLAAHTGGKQHG